MCFERRQALVWMERTGKSASPTRTTNTSNSLHCVVPGGGISLDGSRWVACRPGFFLPVKVLSRPFPKTLPPLSGANLRGRQAAVLRRTAGTVGSQV